MSRSFAIVTGASSGIGLELAAICAQKGFDHQAVHHGTRAFVDSFSLALRAELKERGVTVTCLMTVPCT